GAPRLLLRREGGPALRGAGAGSRCGRGVPPPRGGRQRGRPAPRPRPIPPPPRPPPHLPPTGRGPPPGAGLRRLQNRSGRHALAVVGERVLLRRGLERQLPGRPPGRL